MARERLINPDTQSDQLLRQINAANHYVEMARRAGVPFATSEAIGAQAVASTVSLPATQIIEQKTSINPSIWLG